MACEKICKAAMINAGVDPFSVQRSHAHIAKQLPNLVKLYMGKESKRKPRPNWVVKATANLARKIELLNPSVDDAGHSPQNCEYPWAGPEGRIIAPANHKFDFGILFEPAGIQVLKTLRQAADDLQKG